MRKHDVMPPRYYRTAGFPDEPLVQEIELARMEDFDGDNGKTRKLVVYFKKQRSGLVVGSVVFDQLVSATGEDDTDAWPGHVVEIFKTTCQFGAKTVDCLRIRRPTGAAKKSAPKRVAANADTEEVPF
jgi:hypothetical protein